MKNTKIVLFVELTIFFLLASFQIKDQSVLTPKIGSIADVSEKSETMTEVTPTMDVSATPTPAPTLMPFTKEDFEISQEDLEIDINKLVEEDGLLINGLANLKKYFGYTSAIHVRWKIQSDDTCYTFRFFPYMHTKSSAMDPYILGTGGCDYSTLDMEFIIEDRVTDNLPSISRGTIVTVPGKSIDMVTWLEQGDTPTYYVFAWETENPNIYYLNKTLLVGLEAQAYEFVVNPFSGAIHLDTLEVIKNDVDSYLWFNAPAFKNNFEDIMALYNTNLPSQPDDFAASHSETVPLFSKSYQEENFSNPLELNFDDVNDGKYFGGVDRALNIKDGKNKLSEFDIREMNFRPRLTFDSALHIRWKLSTQNSCETFELSRMDNHGYELEQYYKTKIGGCVSEDLGITFDLKNKPINPRLPFKSKGAISLEKDKWIDTVIWIEKGSSPTLHLFAWETEDPDVYYAEKIMLAGLEETKNFVFYINANKGQMEVDFLKIISGDIKNYLWFNAPTYQRINDEITTLFNADLAAQIEEAEREKDQIIASLRPQAPDFSELMKIVYADMISYEDLPLKFRFHQIEQSVNTSADNINFRKTYLQGPTSGGGGLWLTHVLTIRDEAFTSEDDFRASLNFDPRKDQLRANYPAVGDYSISFFHISFERYVFSKGNVTVDFYCNSLFTGAHPYCNSKTLADLAQVIYDRLPDKLEKPEQIALSIPTESKTDYFNHLEVGGTNQSMLYWNAKTWLHSMDIALYDKEFKQFVYYSQGVDVVDFRNGDGEMSIYSEQAGDKGVSTSGDYILYVIVDQQKAGEIRFTREE